jgi:TonB family protein
MGVQRVGRGFRCAFKSVSAAISHGLPVGEGRGMVSAMRTLSRGRLPALLALASLALPAPAATAPPRKPTSPWKVDFGDAHCIAMRDYGSAASPLQLAFKPSLIGAVMQVSIIRPGDKVVTNQSRGSVTIDGAAPAKASVLGYSSKATQSRVSSINLSLDAFRPMRTAKAVRIESPGEIDETFALANLEGVARTLDECVADLRKVWNIENATGLIKQHARQQKTPASLFRMSDYPAVALRGDDSGMVALVILIDEAGKVASCQVTATSGAASLDAQSCAVMGARARFDPALGADGKPVKSGTVTRIRWITEE